MKPKTEVNAAEVKRRAEIFENAIRRFLTERTDKTLLPDFFCDELLSQLDQKGSRFRKNIARFAATLDEPQNDEWGSWEQLTEGCF